MSHLQINEDVRSQHDFERTATDVAEIEESRSQREALREGLRQRDAWLRKAWGRRSTIDAIDY